MKIAAVMMLMALMPTLASAQITNPTLEEFVLYDDSYIYSNLYHAVNERCYALMWSRDTNQVEHYDIDPIPELYEVAYKDTFRSAITNVIIGTNTFTVTNKYLGYQADYPASPPADHVWALIQSAQYPPDEPVLMRKAKAYQRWMFTVSAPTGLAEAIHYDLGMAIHQKTALFIDSQRFGLSHAPPEDVMNTSTGVVWEWNQSKLEVLYNWQTNSYSGEPGYEYIWSNVPPPGFTWDCYLSEEFGQDFSVGILSPEWMQRGEGYPKNYPPLTHDWLTLSNGIGISATNVYIFTNTPPATNVSPGWMTGCFTCHYVTSLVAVATQENVTLSMTNYSYHFPYPFAWTNGGYEYLDNRAPVASIKFGYDNYTELRETNLIVSGGITNVEIITTKERDVVLKVINHEGINDLPQPWAYTFVELFDDDELPDPKIDERLNIHVFYRKATNEYYDSLFDYDLPDFRHLSRIVSNSLAPAYATTTNDFGPGTFNVTPNNYNEPFAEGYHFTLFPGTNSTADFVLSNGVHSMHTTEVIYSIRTNLNEYFPPFPVNDEIIFLGRPLEYRLTPDYVGEKVNISKQWLWQKWLQLNQMKVTRASLTRYADGWTNFHTKVIVENAIIGTSWWHTNTITTNFLSGLYPFGEGPLVYVNTSFLDTITDHSNLVSGVEETMTFEGRMNFVKSTNVAASLAILVGNRYAGPRWQNQGIGIYGGLDYVMALVVTDKGGVCYSNSPSAYRSVECSWTLVYPDGQDLLVDESVSAQTIYSGPMGVGEVYAEWYHGKNTHIVGTTIDDRQVLPEITVMCEYAGNTYTNVFGEERWGWKRTGYYGSILNIVEPVWTWSFQWPQKQE